MLLEPSTPSLLLSDVTIFTSNVIELWRPLFISFLFNKYLVNQMMNYQKLEELTVVQEAVDDGPLVERSKKWKNSSGKIST